jgi:hypothetical protein
LRRQARDQVCHRKRATVGSGMGISAGEQISALGDDPAPAGQNFT